MKAGARLQALRGVPQRYRTDRRTFDSMTSEILVDVLGELSAQFGDQVGNVAVVVEDWPPASDDVGGESDDEVDLLGLYHGVPIGERGSGYHLALPDRITVYRQPILAACRNEAEVRAEIRLTLVHEIGHYFGLGDDELP
jgi:predicted Zn-dependent protease with MMP-like domain